MRRRATSRGGFTLIELLVSLAVMTLALSVVSVVFTTTTRTASRAAAMAETQNWLRQFVAELKADLAGVDPSQSVLVLVGRTQRAALTEERRAALEYYRTPLALAPENIDADERDDARFDTTAPSGWSDPRADILMFLTQRQLASQAPPRDTGGDDFQRALVGGATVAPSLIVYGHAALDRATGDPPTFADRLTHISDETDNISALPLQRWHLARRATLIEPVRDSARSTFASNDLDRLARGYSDDDDEAGDWGALDVQEMLADFSAGVPVLRDPYDSWWHGRREWEDLLYADVADRHVATILERPPLELRSNLSLQAVPGCVWFQVEFLMPEDPRNSATYYSRDVTDDRIARYFDPLRWVPIEDGQTYVFAPDSAENRAAVLADDGTGGRLSDFARLDQDDSPSPSEPPYDASMRRVRLWPYAVRITVRAIDRQGALDEPLERTIIHRFD